jgi:hypothetical protein
MDTLAILTCSFAHFNQEEIFKKLLDFHLYSGPCI